MINLIIFSSYLKKSHIHNLQSENLTRESRVTESAQEIVDSIVNIVDLFQHFSRLFPLI